MTQTSALPIRVQMVLHVQNPMMTQQSQFGAIVAHVRQILLVTTAKLWLTTVLVDLVKMELSVLQQSKLTHAFAHQALMETTAIPILMIVRQAHVRMAQSALILWIHTRVLALLVLPVAFAVTALYLSTKICAQLQPMEIAM